MAISEFSILYRLSSYYENKIVQSVIRNLKKIKGDDLLLSGDNSGLKNVWEEVCVQTQKEESYHWNAYEDLINKEICSKFHKLPKEIKLVLNYKGSIEQEEDVENEKELYDDFGIQLLYSSVETASLDYKNSRINRCLGNDCD
jgi:hypothetical protein